MVTFAEFIARRRKELDLTQKKVATCIKQNDGKPLSVQYLNDLEHGRRGAPPNYVIRGLAKALRISLDVLYFRAGRIPPDIHRRQVSDERAAAACRALRRTLRKPQKKS